MNSRKLTPIALAGILILTASFAAFYPGGAPAGYSGSPADGKNCASCHGTAATTAAGWITSNIPAEGYTPGQSYQVTATNNMGGSGNYGFEISPQNSAGTLLGTLTAGTNSKLVGSGKYITQSSASSVKTWTFTWVAPAAGSGAVTFYGAFARNYKGETTLSTLVVAENKITTGTDEVAAAAMKLYPSPCNGTFTVALDGMKSEASLKIVDLTGNAVFSTIVSGRGPTTLTTQLTAGTYLVHITDGIHQFVKKLVVR